MVSFSSCFLPCSSAQLVNPSKPNSLLHSSHNLLNSFTWLPILHPSLSFVLAFSLYADIFLFAYNAKRWLSISKWSLLYWKLLEDNRGATKSSICFPATERICFPSSNSLSRLVDYYIVVVSRIIFFVSFCVFSSSVPLDQMLLNKLLRPCRCLEKLKTRSE